MRQIWSPWRVDYVTGDRDSDGCPFCRLPQEPNDRENLILHRGRHCYVIMNLYPYINGHMMIVPYLHTDNLADLTPETQAEIMSILIRCIQALQAAMAPDGVNVGMNLGRASGAGISDHLHMHIVPRWVGDTSFMSVLCDTRVISEGLQETYDKLKPFFDAQAVQNPPLTGPAGGPPQ